MFTAVACWFVCTTTERQETALEFRPTSSLLCLSAWIGLWNSRKDSCPCKIFRCLWSQHVAKLLNMHNPLYLLCVKKSNSYTSNDRRVFCLKVQKVAELISSFHSFTKRVDCRKIAITTRQRCINSLTNNVNWLERILTLSENSLVLILPSHIFTEDIRHRLFTC